MLLLFRFILLSSLLVLSSCLDRKITNIASKATPPVHLADSPSGKLQLIFELKDGVPTYRLNKGASYVILSSELGAVLEEEDLSQNFEIIGYQKRDSSSTWTQPWGEVKQIEDTHQELAVFLKHESGKRMNIIFRLYDTGLGFRYEWPEQDGMNKFVIMEEKTEFVLAGNHDAWWLQAYIPNRYEHLNIASKASQIDTAATPLTMKTADGLYLSFHEAALTDYSSMSLINRGENKLQATLFPWMDGTGHKVRAKTPFVSPWRTIKVNEDLNGLVNNYIELNLNEPSKIKDTSWIKPGKYVGIWWDMHLNRKTWYSGEKHGATTEYTKKWINFAAKHGFGGVLVEGWNITWDGNWIENSDQFRFTESYPDYDLEEVTEYAQSKGTNIIMHNETSTGIDNYESQIDEAFAYYEKLGINTIKSGYVGDMIANGEWHHGQYMVRHYRKVVKKAAEHGIMMDVHEPIKDTGIRRTWPNMMTREGARGQEYNAWSGDGGNPPNYIPTILFTRMLSGPFDYTPGILDVLLKDNDEGRPNNRVHSTIAGELAIYVVIYSPLHMAADLMKNYEQHPVAFQFIKDVPTDWEYTKLLKGEIGKHATVVRKDRNSDDWYLGAVTDETAREYVVNLDFLEEGKKYNAIIYSDGPGADYETNPYLMVKYGQIVDSNATLKIALARGGGMAVRFKARD
tara:strand:+ start:2202 stop:4250 length:2049 start_codon:yes stop_codon:yes gene_type:complete